MNPHITLCGAKQWEFISISNGYHPDAKRSSVGWTLLVTLALLYFLFQRLGIKEVQSWTEDF